MTTKTVADVMKLAKEKEVTFVDFRFTDTKGKEQHVSVPVSHFDEDKFEKDKIWDGLKGYITNCDLKPEEVVENYNNLWHIEKAFRMSKTDLRIRPIYHRLKRRIEAHICLSFVAYSIYKELERVLYLEKFELSVEKAAEITHNMYQLEITLPESLHTEKIILKMDETQAKLIQIISKYF